MLPASAPVPAGDEQAVIAEAERIVREEEDRELRRERRKARGREKQGLARGERERKAVEQAERDEQLRQAAGRLRQAMLDRIRERGAACGGRIMEKVFAAVPDPRDPRGVRHSLGCVLALVMMAMLCDNETLVSITCWISAADQGLLAAAGARALPDGTRQAPCPRTVARVLGAADPDAVEDAVCRYLADGERALQAAGDGGGQQEEEGEGEGEGAPGLMPQVACDGKYVKGARRPDGTSLILLSAATPGGVPLAQREIPAKTSEVPEIGPMLRELNQYYPLTGHVITADALHTIADFAGLVTGELAAGAVLTVKDNQPTIRALLENALWAHAACHVTRDKGHGRRETRSHLVMDAPAEVKALFPPAEQVARVIRTRTVTSWLSDGHTRTRVTRTGTETVYLIITMPARQAPPQHVGAYIRNHWGIENRVHQASETLRRFTTLRPRCGYGPRACWAWRQRLSC
jgi:predicted transposase YbfD/YdcC